MSWYQLKLFLQYSSGISMDSIHVIVGVAVQLLVAKLSRRSVGHFLPWIAVLMLELLNEASDLWIEKWPDPGRQYGESAKDIVVTMFLPTLLLLVVRFCPKLFAYRKAEPAPVQEPGEAAD